MIDHTGLKVSSYAASKAFYERALAPLGYRVMMEFSASGSGPSDHGGLGAGHPDFWLAEGMPNAPRLHIAFSAKNRAAVDAFYKAALAAGGRDNGPPGIRAHYHPHYYGAFVLDLDGHNIEAVCHAPPGGAKKPKRVRFVAELPRTAAGAVDRAAVKKAHGGF